MRRHGKRGLLAKGALAALVVAGVCVAGAAALPSHPASSKETIKHCRKDERRAQSSYKFAKEMQALVLKNKLVFADLAVISVEDATRLATLKYIAGEFTNAEFKKALKRIAALSVATKREVAVLVVESRAEAAKISKRCRKLTPTLRLASIKIDPDPKALPDWKLDGKAGTAHYHTSLWDTDYKWTMPAAVVPGAKFSVPLSIDVTRNDTAQNSFSMGVSIEGGNPDNQLVVIAPTKGSASGKKAVSGKFLASLKDVKEFNALVGFGNGFQLVYTYKRS